MSCYSVRAGSRTGCTDIKRVRVAFRKCFLNVPKNGAIAWIALTLAREGVTSALRKR